MKKRKGTDYNLLGYALATRNVKKSTPNGRRADSADFKKIPSKEDTHNGVAAQAEKKEYTGDVVIGIAVMHKSNLVPVISQKQAEEVGKMRRG